MLTAMMKTKVSPKTSTNSAVDHSGYGFGNAEKCTALPNDEELELIETRDDVTDLPLGLTGKSNSLLSIGVSENSVGTSINFTRKRSNGSCDSDRSVRVCWEEEEAEGAKEQEIVQKEGKSTITRGLLATSGFIWIPVCAPERNSSVSLTDEYFHEAQRCSRMYIRRNALADPHRMLFPQATRERLEKEVASRKSSFTRKISQYFRAMYSDDYEVDLI